MPPELPNVSYTPCKVRSNNNTGALIISNDIDEMKVSGEWVHRLAPRAVLPAAGTAASSELDEAAAPMPPHARPEYPPSQDNPFEVDVSSNSGSVLVFSNVRRVMLQ